MERLCRNCKWLSENRTCHHKDYYGIREDANQDFCIAGFKPWNEFFGKDKKIDASKDITRICINCKKSYRDYYKGDIISIHLCHRCREYFIIRACSDCGKYFSEKKESSNFLCLNCTKKEKNYCRDCEHFLSGGRGKDYLGICRISHDHKILLGTCCNEGEKFEPRNTGTNQCKNCANYGKNLHYGMVCRITNRKKEPNFRCGMGTPEKFVSRLKYNKQCKDCDLFHYVPSGHYCSWNNRKANPYQLCCTGQFREKTTTPREKESCLEVRIFKNGGIPVRNYSRHMLQADIDRLLKQLDSKMGIS